LIQSANEEIGAAAKNSFKNVPIQEAIPVEEGKPTKGNGMKKALKNTARRTATDDTKPVKPKALKNKPPTGKGFKPISGKGFKPVTGSDFMPIG